MEFDEILRKRYSVRGFSAEPVDDATLTAILTAGNLAPTAKNSQSHHVYIIRSEEKLALARECIRSHYDAPVILLFTYDTEKEWHNQNEEWFGSGVEDASIVATHIMLKATDLGVGTLWVNNFMPTKIKEALDLPEREIPVLVMPMGYPREDVVTSVNHLKRKPLGETVSYL